MKTHIFRLGSVGAHGVGGPEAIAIDLMYDFLLQEFEQDMYSHIHINHINDDLNEFVMKEPGNKVHVNIRYPTYEDFEIRSVDEQNRIRLNVVHNGLLRIAEYDKKLEVAKLEAIRNKILKNNFSFDFVYKTHVYKKRPNMIAKIIVHPGNKQFDYYTLVEENGKEKCKVHIYSGLPASIYNFKDFFSLGKWKGENELVITGKANIIETHILIEKCKVEYVNLTPYKNPPLFEVRRAGISEEDREKAHQDWLHSLPPSHAAIIRQAHN